MKKEWFTAKELVGIAGLPKTPQAINHRARNEQWLKRKRLGIQGKAIEYHISSFPIEVHHFIEIGQHAKEQGPNYSVTTTDPLTIWLSTYNQLTAKEREQIISLIIRHGINGLIKNLKDE